MCEITAESQDTLLINCEEKTVTITSGQSLKFTESWVKFEAGDEVQLTIDIDYHGDTFDEKEYYLVLANPEYRTTYTGEEGIMELFCEDIVSVR